MNEEQFIGSRLPVDRAAAGKYEEERTEHARAAQEVERIQALIHSGNAARLDRLELIEAAERLLAGATSSEGDSFTAQGIRDSLEKHREVLKRIDEEQAAHAEALKHSVRALEQLKKTLT